MAKNTTLRDRIIQQEDPTQMPDALATKLGLKEYFGDETGTLDVTLTSPVAGGLSITRAVFIPYQTQDGTWRMRFNITGTANSNSNQDIELSGVLFKNGPFQPTAGHANNGTLLTNYATSNDDRLVNRYSASVIDARVSGDVELESKPTWAA